jgi:hypothetical protein
MIPEPAQAPVPRQGRQLLPQPAGHTVGVAQMAEIDRQVITAGGRRHRIAAFAVARQRILKMQGPVVLHGDHKNKSGCSEEPASKEQTFSATARSLT